MSNAKGRLVAAKETDGDIEVTVRMAASQWRRLQYAFTQPVLILDEDAGARYMRSLPTVKDMAGVLADTSGAPVAGSDEVDKLREQLRKEDISHGHTIDQRDAAQRKLDEFVTAVNALTGVDYGEHSNQNDPWQNALDDLNEMGRRLANERGERGPAQPEPRA